MGLNLHLHSLQLRFLAGKLLLINVDFQRLYFPQQSLELLACHFQLQNIVVSVFIDPLLLLRIFQAVYKLLHRPEDTLIVYPDHQRASNDNSYGKEYKNYLQAHNFFKYAAAW